MVFFPQQRKLTGEGRGGFGAEPGQVQQGFGEGSGEGRGGFGVEPGQVQQGSGEVQQGSEEGSGRSGRLGAAPGQVQQGSGEGPGEGFRNPWCRAGSGSTGFPALRFAARFRTICKNKTLRLLGIPADTTEAYFFTGNHRIPTSNRAIL